MTVNVLRDFALFLLSSLVLAVGLALWLDRCVVVAQVLAVAGAITALLFWHLPLEPGRAGIGPANRVTLLRAVPVVLLAGLVGPTEWTDGLRWSVLAAAGSVLLLDGLDGWVARRTRTSSAFGARFDMELDALFILILCLLVWQSGQTGAWVLGIGLLRYAFVVAGWLWPQLQQPLCESLRRKAICVLQGVILPICLIPQVTPFAASLLAAGAFGLLLYSFAIDTAVLLRPGSTAARQH